MSLWCWLCIGRKTERLEIRVKQHVPRNFDDPKILHSRLLANHLCDHYTDPFSLLYKTRCKKRLAISDVIAIIPFRLTDGEDNFILFVCLGSLAGIWRVKVFFFFLTFSQRFFYITLLVIEFYLFLSIPVVTIEKAPDERFLFKLVLLFLNWFNKMIL